MRSALQTLALLCLAAIPVFGQGALYQDRVQAVDGRAIGGVLVSVCTYSSGQYTNGVYTGPIPCTPTVTTYYDPALTEPLTPPILSDSQGNVFVYLAPGSYTVTYSARNINPRGFAIVVPCAPSASSSTCASAAAPLNSTQVGFGSGGNILTGSANLTYNTNLSALLQAASGVFTNSAANLFHEVTLNSCNPAALFSAIQGGNHQTDAFTGCVAVPSGATVYGANAVAGYGTNSSTSTNAVGLYAQMTCLVSGSNCWGENPLVSDANAISVASMRGQEIDVNVLGTPASVVGSLMTGNWSGAFPAGASAYWISRNSGAQLWPFGFNCGIGSVQVCLELSPQGSGANQPSSTIVFSSINGSSLQKNSSFQQISDGELQLNPAVDFNINGPTSLTNNVGGTAITSQDGSALTSLYSGVQAAGNSQPSQTIVFDARNSGGTLVPGNIGVLATGDMQFLDNTGIFDWTQQGVGNLATFNFAGNTFAEAYIFPGGVGSPSSGTVCVSGFTIAGCGGGCAFDNGLGTGYQDATEIAAPSNPASGNDRLYLSSSTHLLACVTSGGANCMPSSGGGGVSSFTGDGALLSNSASTGAVTATLNSAGAYNLWSNNTNATATPGYHALNSFPAAAFPTLNQNTTGTAGGLSGCTVTSAGSICYWNGTAWTVFAGNSSGTSVFQENASGVPSWGSGASTTFEANTTPLSSSSTVNFENSTSFNGLTATFANPSAGNVQLGFSGTLGNAGLTNSSLTVSTSSPLSGGGLVSLGGSLSLSCPSCVTSLPPFETNGTNNTSQALLNFANTSGAGEIDFTNPSGGIEQATLHNTATTVNSQTCTLGSTCTVTAAPSGSAGGDLGSTYPNPTVVQIEGGVIPVSAAVVGTNSSKQPIAATAHGIASPLACSDTSGSGTAQSCTSNPSYTPASGDWIIYKTTTANTGDVTVNVNSTSAAHVRKWQGSSVLASGDLAANIPMLMQYDGTFWELYTIGNAPSGSGFANPMTTIGDMIGGGASGAATRIPAGLTGQVPVATNGSAPAFASPGLPDSANSPVTSSYTLAADTATAIVDRAHTLRFQSGSATCTVPAISTTGVGVGFVTALMGDGAGTVTCSRSSTDSFSVFNGATNSDSQTSFTFANGDFVSLSAAATGVWEVRITHQGSGGSGCTISGTQYQLVTVASGGTSCTPANVQVDSTLNNLVFPTPSGTTYGTVTTLHIACYTGSQQIGNCGTSATNVLGVFTNSSGGYQATGWLSGIVLDGTQSPAFGDILCASTTTGGEVHDNGSTLCGSISFIGIVSTSATSVTTVSAWLAVKTPSTGLVTGGTCTNQVTTAISTSGVPTCTTMTGAYMASATVTATQLAAQYSKGSCTELWGGSGTSFALSSGDDAIADNSCYNDSGVTRTITAVKCRSDIASNTTTVNPTFGSAGTGTAILSGALTCGSSLAYSSTGTVTNASWTTGTGINPVQGGTLTGTSIAVIVEFTY